MDVGVEFHIPEGTTPFEIVSLDMMGPLQTSFKGNNFILATICNLSRFVIAEAVPDAKGSTFSEWFESRVINVYGTPKVVISDNGANFLSDEAVSMFRRFGIKHITSTPLNPRGNSLIQRANGTLSNALKAGSDGSGADKRWDTRISAITAAYSRLRHSATERSPEELVFSFKRRQRVDPGLVGGSALEVSVD